MTEKSSALTPQDQRVVQSETECGPQYNNSDVHMPSTGCLEFFVLEFSIGVYKIRGFSIIHKIDSNQTS